MHIVVCVKQVPTPAGLKFDRATKTIQRENVPLEINSFDARALVRAKTIKAQIPGTRVTALSLGPPSAREALVEALALGADRAVLLSDPRFRGSDTLATSRALAAFLRANPADLVLCGRYSVDAETSQVGPELAELLGLPHVSLVYNIDSLATDTRSVEVERETDTGWERLRLRLPALLTVTEGVAPEEFPTKSDLEQARAKSIEVFSCDDLALSEAEVGFSGSPTWVRSLEEVAPTRRQLMIDASSPAEAVTQLVTILVDEFGLFSDWKVPEPPRLSTLPTSPLRTDPADILVLGEVRDGRIERVTWELVAKATELAGFTQGIVHLLLLGEAVGPEALPGETYGVDHIHFGSSPHLATYQPWEHAACLVDTIQRLRPRFVLGPSTAYGRDVLPRAAAALGLGLTADCIDLGLDETGSLLQYKPAFGGSIVATISSHTIPEMATVRPGVFSAVPAQSLQKGTPIQERIDLRAPRHAFSIQRVGGGTLPDLGADLDHAEIVVGIGKGVGADGVEKVRSFAQRLGAAVCTTRDVADEGWLPRQLQVGLTGRSIAPKLYIALGIRGAFEHMVGVRRAGIIVAVNRNARAPVFRHSDLGLVADVHEILPLFDHALAEEHARRT